MTGPGSAHAAGGPPGAGGEALPAARVLQAGTAAGVGAFAGLYAVQAMLPAVARELDIDAVAASVVQSAGPLGLAVAVLPWAIAARRGDPLRMLRVAVVASALLALVVPLASDVIGLVSLRLLQGAAIAGMATLTLAVLRQISAPAGVLRVGGWYIAGTSLGGLSGRLIGAFVGDVVGWRLGLFAGGILCVIAAVVTLVTLRGAPHPSPVATREPLLRVMRRPAVSASASTAFLLMGAFSALYTVVGFRLVGPEFGLPDALVAVVFLTYLLGTASAALLGSGGRDPRRTLALAVAAQSVGILVTVSGWLPAVVMGLGLASAGFFAAHAIAASEAAAGGGAAGSAAYTLAYYVGAGIVAVAGAALFQAAGWAWFAAALAAFSALAVPLAGRVVGGRSRPDAEPMIHDEP